MNFVNAADAAAFTSASPVGFVGTAVEAVETTGGMLPIKNQGVALRELHAFTLVKTFRKWNHGKKQVDDWPWTMDVHPFEASAGDITNLAWPIDALEKSIKVHSPNWMH